jgi:hypothetical protein
MGKRIRKSENVLQLLLAVNDYFYIGINYEHFAKSISLNNFSLPNNYRHDQKFMPAAKGPITKSNLEGKLVRKQPEEKEVKQVLIDFINKHGTHVHYVRDYNVWVKEITHQFKIPLQFVENEHGQKIVVSPKLLFDNSYETNLMNTHVINLFYELFDDYEVYTENLDLALAFNKKYDFDILPKGEFEDDDLTYIVEGARRFVKNEEEVKSLQARLRVIQEYKPEVIGKGPEGFYGYIVFGFKEKGYVILESMYMGNASYQFDYDGFEELIKKNKQDLLSNKLVKKRFFHRDSWEKNIRGFLEK